MRGRERGERGRDGEITKLIGRLATWKKTLRHREELNKDFFLVA